MDDQTTMTADPNNATASATSSVPPGHRTVGNNEYEVTFHPAFASACKVKKNGQETELYRQGDKQEDVIDCTDGHPHEHTIRIRGKGNGRDITITVHDPSHTLHSISFDLYKEARDRRKAKSGTQAPGAVDMQASADAADMQASAGTADMQASADVSADMQASDGASADVGETFTLENDAKTCPPYCTPTDPNNPT